MNLERHCEFVKLSNFRSFRLKFKVIISRFFSSDLIIFNFLTLSSLHSAIQIIKTMCYGLTGPRFAYALDFACAFANLRPDLKLGKSASHSAARIQMMSHHMSKPCETVPRSSNFHITLPSAVIFNFNCNINMILIQVRKLPA